MPFKVLQRYYGFYFYIVMLVVSFKVENSQKVLAQQYKHVWDWKTITKKSEVSNELS